MGCVFNDNQTHHNFDRKGLTLIYLMDTEDPLPVGRVGDKGFTCGAAEQRRRGLPLAIVDPWMPANPRLHTADTSQLNRNDVSAAKTSKYLCTRESFPV
jgi:hypothetical protein